MKYFVFTVHAYVLDKMTGIQKMVAKHVSDQIEGAEGMKGHQNGFEHKMTYDFVTISPPYIIDL